MFITGFSESVELKIAMTKIHIIIIHTLIIKAANDKKKTLGNNVFNAFLLKYE